MRRRRSNPFVILYLDHQHLSADILRSLDDQARQQGKRLEDVIRQILESAADCHIEKVDVVTLNPPRLELHLTRRNFNRVKNIALTKEIVHLQVTGWIECRLSRAASENDSVDIPSSRSVKVASQAEAANAASKGFTAVG
jgi:hypothetical protein